MTGRARSVLVAASLVLLLAGCSAHEPPPSYTDSELEVYFQKRLDAAWLNTGLDGQVERPVIAGSAVDRFEGDAGGSFGVCVSQFGMDSWGSTESNGGPRYTDGTGTALDPDMQLEVYRCLAEFPQMENYARFVLTADQRDYLYDYYSRWIVPCLIVNDFELDFLPTRQEFLDADYGWNPYFSISDGFTGEEYEGFIALCGDPYADLDVDATMPF